MTSHVAANIDRFSGFADCYDRHRPEPPAVFTEILTQLLVLQRRLSMESSR